jgi:hypothetical protein
MTNRLRMRMIAIAVLTLAGTIVQGRAQAADDHLCFPETRQCLRDRFQGYWQASGGLPVFGFPITAATDEVSRDTGKTYLTQWLERNRFELHPENAAPYDVLLGRLGDDRLRQQGVDWRTLPKAAATDAHYFAPTGQAVAHAPFWQYWSTHGLELGDPGVSARESLALFGLPISPPRTETNSSGDTVLTQWFERARFEDHGAKGVLLGLLGNEVRTGMGASPLSPVPAPQPTPAPSAPPTAGTPSFNSCQPDNRALVAPNYPVQIVAVDKRAELVTLKNTGSTPVNLGGWHLCSFAGAQEQGGVAGTLQPGQQLQLRNAGSPIWADSERDDGALYNAQGVAISYFQDSDY